jgi:hypothetical protein
LGARYCHGSLLREYWRELKPAPAVETGLMVETAADYLASLAAIERALGRSGRAADCPPPVLQVLVGSHLLRQPDFSAESFRFRAKSTALFDLYIRRGPV